MRTSLILREWFAARRAMRASAASLERQRARLWGDLQPTLAQTPALTPFAGRAHGDFPMIRPHDMRADYGRWNSLGLTDAALREAAKRAEAGEAGEPIPGVTVGFSTGTSGERGLFVASAAERALYIGQSIARMLPPRMLLTGARIALFLRANSALYSDVERGGRFRFAHFPLGGDAAEHAAALAAFAPHILIAPSHILAGLARAGWRSATLRRCFFGAEPMGDAEREWIAATLGVRPDPIYQATEGFLGAACRFGRLHLNDDSLIVELQPISGTNAFQPIVTDLRRTSQPIVRVLLDDIVEPDDRPCRCGFAGRTIRPVMGRIGDIWHYGARTITPREVTDIVEGALGTSAIWTAHASPKQVMLSVAGTGFERAATLLRDRLALPVPIETTEHVGPVAAPKRNRVRWSAADG